MLEMPKMLRTNEKEPKTLANQIVQYSVNKVQSGQHTISYLDDCDCNNRGKRRICFLHALIQFHIYFVISIGTNFSAVTLCARMYSTP